MKYASLIMLCLAAMTVSGCAGIAKGVTEALMENSPPQEKNKACEIEGPEFDGIAASLEEGIAGEPRVVKVLMVHGIGTHTPGYATRFRHGLVETLGLREIDAAVKSIALDSEAIEWGQEPHILGQLNVTRHQNEAGTKQLLFYELTWSPITVPQKRNLEADSANTEGLKRASMNASLKRFMNATVPDLLIYNGNGFDRITRSVGESVCWMLFKNWNDLPESGQHVCDVRQAIDLDALRQDGHFFVTHSLGSRITIDTIQHFASFEFDEEQGPIYSSMRKIIREKEFTVFMMANQLPLLQMGRVVPGVTDNRKAYCSAQGALRAERVMKRMNIIAFSDPNDILSYPVSRQFAAENIDSRICPSISNVSLNVAGEKDVFGFLSFANPQAAHGNYISDERVADLIANGLNKEMDSLSLREGCKWQRVSYLAEGAARSE